MSNRYDRSRSPVRAINAASQQPSFTAAHRPHAWSDSEARGAAAFLPAARRMPDDTELACPDCGSMLRLGLVRSTTEAMRHGAPAEPRRALRAAPEPGRLPDFEESIQGYKRDLIRRALDENAGVMTRAAKALGLKYTTFVAMVHRLGVLDGEQAHASD